MSQPRWGLTDPSRSSRVSSGRGGTSSAVERVYSYAPFEFQRAFRRLRLDLANLKRARIVVPDYGTTLAPRVERVFSTLPDRDFPEVAARAPAVESTIIKILERMEFPYPLATELAEHYWFWFCYYLRLHPDAHENVPQEALELWASKLEDQNRIFHRKLGDIVIELAMLAPEVWEDNVLGPIAVSRSREREEEDVVFKEFEDDLEGLDECLTKIHGSFVSK